LISLEEMHSTPANKVMILATGAQGDEFAALMRTANKTHKHIKISKNDTIILSSSIIPGNERPVQKLKDNLSRQGAHIIHYQIAGVHSGGHAHKEDAKWIQQTDAEITVALYGNTPSIHDSITGIDGSFSSSLMGLKNLVDTNSNVCVYFVPMRQNLHSIGPLIDMVDDLGVQHFRVLSLSPTGRAKAQFENLEITENDIKESYPAME